MGDENLAAGAVERWQARAENLISFAAVAAPLRDDDYGRFLEAGFSEPEAKLEGDVSDFLQSSEDAVPDGSGTSGLPVLLGNLEVANTLLVASQEPETALAERGPDGTSSTSLTRDSPSSRLPPLAQSSCRLDRSRQP